MVNHFWTVLIKDQCNCAGNLPVQSEVSAQFSYFSISKLNSGGGGVYLVMIKFEVQKTITLSLHKWRQYEQNLGVNVHFPGTQ